MRIVTVGQGEIGAPLTKMFEEAGHTVFAKDIEPLEVYGPIDTMIVSIPFKDKDSFCSIVWDYIRAYKPNLVVINSTVLPGTTGQIQWRVLASSNSEEHCGVVHSPIMGRHRKDSPEMMFEDIRAYPKFIGADDDFNYEAAEELFGTVGLKTVRMSSSKTSELAKLLETTYSGILIGWMQEVEQFCQKYDVDWKETLQLPEAANERIEFQRPTNVTPGFIGGHCIMPNIELLLQENESKYLDAVVNSNKRKEDEA